MRHFQFSHVFTNRRKQLGVTQEQIADYVGVSRAAVSKWEKGLSYPDITLLPKLATYFNVSIDELLGYEPQLTKERIAKLYANLAKQFSEKAFEEVEQEIEQLVAEYYACFPFVLKMAQLYINYYSKSSEPTAILQRVEQLCLRVKESSEDYQLINEANMIGAYVKLLQGRPTEVLEMLGEEVTIHLGRDQLVATAHNMLGNAEEAKKILQVSMYQNMLATIATGTEGLLLEVANPTHFDETVDRMKKLIEVFHVETLNVNTALVFYLKAAIGYAMQNRKTETLEMLKLYVKTCIEIQFPLAVQGDDYFYLLTDWIIKEMSAQAPRDEQSIKKDLLSSASLPAFQLLQEDKEYKALIQNLKHHLNIEEGN
ncbi:MAG: helix-turn-helix domain-containing protein [Lysinibacillus sp.]